MAKKLFFLQSLSQGGAETYLLRYLRYENERENYVFCKSGKAGVLKEPYEKVAHVETPFSIGLYNILDYIRLYRYMKRMRFDVVCDFQGNFSGWTLFCAKLAGVRTRIAFYRESVNQFKPTLGRRFYAAIIKRVMSACATKILSNSYAALNHFHSDHLIHKTKYHVIYNGFDIANISSKTRGEVRSLLSVPNDAFIVGHSGRYTAAKNHDMIIDCACELCSKHKGIYFLLMGRDVEKHYAERIEALGLSEQIRLLGYRSDVLDILPSLDLFYFPSLNEGQPNALIEAMLQGLPFVASDIAPIKETVPSFLYSQLVSPTDMKANLKILEDSYKQKDELNRYTCGKWAKEKYDASLNFNEFREELHYNCSCLL